MVSMAIMVASFRHSLDAWLERILPADVYVRAASRRRHRLPHARRCRRMIAALPGVRARRVPARAAAAARSRAAARRAAGARPSIRAIAGTQPADRRRRRSPWRADAPPPVWVSEAAADLYGFAPGRVIDIAARGQDANASRSPASGATTGASRARSSIERARYVALTGDTHGDQRRAVARRRRRRVAAFEARSRATIPGGERLEIARPERDPRRCRCACSTARSR